MTTTLEPLYGKAENVTVHRTAARWVSVVSHLDPKYGGLSAAVPQLAREVEKVSAVTFRLAAFCAPGEAYVPPGFANHGISHWPTSRVAWLKDRALSEWMREELRDADGIHVHGLWEQSTAVACRLARSLGKPYVLSAHGMLEPWALRNKRVKKLVYAALAERANVRGAACLHALTMSEAASYRRFGGRGPIAVIPNGVRVPLALSPEKFLGAFPALQGKRILLFLSRLHPKKGLDLLVPAWAALAKRWPEAHLVVAGPDFEGTRAAIEGMVAEHGLTGSVLFTGMLDEPMKWSALAAAECFVLPSRSEGLSMSALEAMGAGVPVIVTKPCNMPEVPTIGAGWEIELTVEELIGTLSAMLGQSQAMNREIGIRGQNRIAERYGWDTVARQMAQVYAWVQGGGPPEDVEVLRG